MPLTCPRCSIPLTPVRAAPHTGGAPVELDLCDRCQGLWIDGPELAAVCPTVAHLPDHRGEVALRGKQGAGIQQCPRCGKTPYEFDIAEVLIDFCAGCAGVWFDGDEYGEIPFDRPASSADAPQGGPYRKAAVEVARSGEVTCSGCGAKTPFKHTHMWEQGLLCRACHAVRLQSEPHRPVPHSMLADGFLALLQDAFGILESPATKALRRGR